MTVAQCLSEVGEVLRHEVEILGVADDATPPVLGTHLRVFLGQVLVVDGAAILVVELTGQLELRQQLPLGGTGGDHIQHLGLVGPVLADGDGVAVVVGGGLVIAPVLVVDRVDGVAPVRLTAVVVAVAQVEDVRGPYGEVVEQLVAHVQVVSTLHVVVVHVHAHVGEVVGAQVEAGGLVGARHPHGGVVREGALVEDQLVPAGVGGPAGLQLLYGGVVDPCGVALAHVERRHAAVDASLVAEHRHQHGIAPQVEPGGELGEGELLLHRHQGGALLRPSCGDQDHAVGAARSVDGGGRGIFQYLHRDDVVGVDLLQVAGVTQGEAIHHDQGCVRSP